MGETLDVGCAASVRFPVLGQIYANNRSCLNPKLDKLFRGLRGKTSTDFRKKLHHNLTQSQSRVLHQRSEWANIGMQCKRNAVQRNPLRHPS